MKGRPPTSEVDHSTVCGTCEYAQAHGWWGPTMAGRTHCRRCHKSWGGTAHAHCTVCCETFASDGVAQHHWKTNGHVHPSEIAAFWQDTDGFWHHGPKRPGLPMRATLGTLEPFREGMDTSEPVSSAR